MNLYQIVWADGTDMIEYGDSEQDIRDFLKRSYMQKGEPVSIKLWGG